MTPSDFLYERYAPGPALTDYIEHFWIVTATVGTLERREILVPNGRPTIIVNLGDAGRRLDPVTGDSAVNGTAITGLATRPTIIAQSGVSKLVAAQPTPFGLHALGCPPLVDAKLTMGEWCGHESAERLEHDVGAAPFGEPAVRVLERFLSERLTPLPPASLERLKKTIATIDIDDADTLGALAGELGIGYDRLYREFRNRVGISLKAFAAIVRYQRLVGGLLASQPGNGLAQLAIMQGYYDQAHANRDFRRFTGVTPNAFRRALGGIARMMHQI